LPDLLDALLQARDRSASCRRCSHLHGVGCHAFGAIEHFGPRLEHRLALVPVEADQGLERARVKLHDQVTRVIVAADPLEQLHAGLVGNLHVVDEAGLSIGPGVVAHLLQLGNLVAHVGGILQRATDSLDNGVDCLEHFAIGVGAVNDGLHVQVV
jgi:hypothetical protein